MRIAFAILAVTIAAPALAKGEPSMCPGPIQTPLFISPVGEPFRPQPDGGDPVKRWFDGADRNHDGQLTQGELMLDADRFFATLDKDHNGELLPDELTAYEEDVAPEVRMYQARPQGGGFGGGDMGGGKRPKRSKGSSGYDGPMGAGRYSFLNVPNPVASADADMNRAIDLAEFRKMAADRFDDLDPRLTRSLAFASLPRTPAQVEANQRCLDKIKQAKKNASGRAPQTPKEPSP